MQPTEVSSGGEKYLIIVSNEMDHAFTGYAVRFYRKALNCCFNFVEIILRICCLNHSHAAQLMYCRRDILA